MPQDTRMTLCLLEQLIKALRANDPDTFKGWLSGGVEDLGEPAVTELLLDWLDAFITKVETDRVSTNTNDYQFHPLLLTHTSTPSVAPLCQNLN